MKQLRQYIRQVLLTEGMKTSADLPDNVVVVINATDTIAVIYYGKIEDPNKEADLYGEIQIYAPSDSYYGNCGNAWMVGGSAAAHGWGPLLYDVAIEWATQNAGGLIADRNSVSEAAEAVWRHYMTSRSDDVKALQMDDLDNYFTPQEEDNCNQDSAMDHEGPNGWMDSPLSKRYTKSPTTMAALGKKLVIL